MGAANHHTLPNGRLIYFLVSKHPTTLAEEVYPAEKNLFCAVLPSHPSRLAKSKEALDKV